MLPFDRSRAPTYDLEEVQRLVGQGPISCTVSQTALLNADDLGLGYGDVIEAVLLLSPAEFYKTMESERVPGSWQDVYRSSYAGLRLYIKVQINARGLAVVIQFKER